MMFFNCQRCGKKLSFFASLFSKRFCLECEEAMRIENERKNIELANLESIITSQKNFELTNEQIKLLKEQSKAYRINLFMKLYKVLEEDNEITFSEYNLLKDFQEKLELTNEEINFDDNILPYLFVAQIKSEGTLPELRPPRISGSEINLQSGEKIHFYFPAILNEKRVVKTNYGGGSYGVSFRVAKGIRYHIGSHRGNILRQETLVETSRGILLITNQRIVLQPELGFKPISIPLNKILSYQCFSNSLLVFKEGREKGYYFTTSKSGWVEVAGICLTYFLKIV
ncbi:MAG: hypothetical protein ACUVQ1_03430 [Candidatus Kapaibacteriales bacterium]